MKGLGFVHSEMLVDYLIADRVDHIVPMLMAAVRDVPERELHEAAQQIERM
jgi:hypothetical protein